MNRHLWLCFAAMLLGGCVSSHPGASGDKIRVIITPDQAMVLYLDGVVLCGGWSMR